MMEVVNKTKKLDSGSRSGMTSLGNYAFIDSQNLNMGIRSQKWTLDYGRFRNYLRDKYKVEKALLFIGFMPENQKLYQSLQEAGFLLIFKPILEVKNRKTKEVTVKGNVDAELVMHTIINLEKYNKAVIVSGDGDFFCLVEYLDSVGKLLKVITPSTKYSSLLRKYSKYVLNLGMLKEKLRYQAKGGLSTKKRGIS